MLIRLLVTCLAGAACTSAASGQESFAGCYDLTLQDFEGWAMDTGDSVYYRPPPRVELRTTGPGPQHIAVPNGSVPSPHGRALWSVREDTLRVVWTTGYVGLSAELVRDDTLLRGVASPFTDVGGGPPPPQAAIVATPVPCDSPTPFPVSSIRRFRPTILLASGGVLALGERPSSTLDAERRRNTLTIRGVGLDLAQGVEEIRVSLDASGRAQWVSLRYPGSHDATTLLANLIERFGQWHEQSADDHARYWSWHGRLESLSLTDPVDGATVLSLSGVRQW